LILHGRVLDQVIDRGEKARFCKEIVVAPGPLPLAMVRKRSDGNGGGTRATILLIHGFGQNRYAWHLPSRSLACYLAQAGFDVFNLELRGHGRSRHMGARRPRSVDDYVREDLPIAMEEVQRLSGPRPVFLVGHSLGGLVSYAAAPALDGAVAGIVSIGSPYHFARGSATLSAIALLVRAMTAARLRPANAPLLLQPAGSFLRSLRPFAERGLLPIRLRGWHAGAVEPRVLDEHLRLAFDRASLAEMMNMFDWAAAKRFGGNDSDYEARFEKLDLPLLAIAGDQDDLAPPAGVRPAVERSPSRDKTYRVLPLGHIDLLIGRDAPLMTWTLVDKWIAKRAA
jgi:polyhydroxyalkanoate synthase